MLFDHVTLMSEKLSISFLQFAQLRALIMLSTTFDVKSMPSRTQPQYVVFIINSRFECKKFYYETLRIFLSLYKLPRVILPFDLIKFISITFITILCEFTARGNAPATVIAANTAKNNCPTVSFSRIFSPVVFSAFITIYRKYSVRGNLSREWRARRFIQM